MRAFKEQRPPQVGPAASKKSIRAGETANPADYQPGDFILVSTDGWYARLIRFGQSLRFFGPDRKYVRWNHAAVVVSPDGEIVEALPHGVVLSHLAKYTAKEYIIIRIDALVRAADREEVVAFARWCIRERFGWLTIVSIALTILTGSKFVFGLDGQSICSGLVARSLERTTAIFQQSSSHIAPADLAKTFDVPPPG
jgi:hypothetical protein